MLPHQERVIEEARDLREKVEKLAQFSNGDVFAGLPTSERQLLIAQLHAMELYLHCLNERIKGFTEDGL